MTMSSYWLGIDLGTTYTAAAICWPVRDGLEVQVVPLSNHSHAIPSVLFLPGDGSVVPGEGAQRRALTDPERVVREFKSRIGDDIPMLVSGSPYFAHDLAAEFVAWLWQYVVEREGQRPDGIALTCPASWGPYKTGLFQRAVQDAGMGHVAILSEPQAAAISYASRERVEVGATLAVYDLGGGTFDAAVVRKDSPTQFTVLGQPEGIEHLGGLSFDEVLFEHVCAAAGVVLEDMDPHDPDLAAEVARLRRECTEAKEALSADTDVTIPVALGSVRQRVRVTRAELEEMIRPDLDRTIDVMHRALGSAGVGPAELDAILLIGGSSRIPLVSQLIAGEFGRAPAIDADPKVAVAMGAARYPAPASSPVHETVETPIQSPRLVEPPERPEMASMLAPAVPEEARHAAGGGPGRRISGKVMAGWAAAFVLVVVGAVAAIRTPVLSDLLAHHTAAPGPTVVNTATPGISGSPSPSAQKTAKPVSTTKAAATTGTSASNTGSVVSVTSSRPVAKASSKQPSAPVSSSHVVVATSPSATRTVRARHSHPVFGPSGSTQTTGTGPGDTGTSSSSPPATPGQ
jgi:cell division ATPase FtsA